MFQQQTSGMPRFKLWLNLKKNIKRSLDGAFIITYLNSLKPSSASLKCVGDFTIPY